MVRLWGKGGGSIVAMQKQSNTNWSHSRGTAGAHRGDSLGGPTARGGGVAERVQVRDGDVGNRSYYRESRAGKESRKEKRKKGWREAATWGRPLYPCNYSELMLVNI